MAAKIAAGLKVIDNRSIATPEASGGGRGASQFPLPRGFARRWSGLILLVAAIVVSVLAVRTTVHRLRALKDGYRHVDFVTYYAWGLEYERGERVWGPAQPHPEAEIAPGVPRPNYHNYTPAFVEAFAPLTRLGETGAYWTWQSIQLACFVAAVFLLTRGCDPPLGFAPALLVAAIGLFFRPLRGILRYAQCAPILMLLMSGSWLSAMRGRKALAGLFLAAATLIKLYPGAMAGYFVMRRDWRALIWWMVFGAAGLIVTGPLQWIDFFRYGVALRYVSAHEIGIWANVYTFASRAMAGRSHLATVSIALALTILADLVLLAFSCWTTIRASERIEAQGFVFAIWLMLCLLLSPLIWGYELVLTAPVCFFALAYGVKLAGVTRDWRSRAFAVFAALIAAIVLSELRDFTGMPGINPRLLGLLFLYFLSCAAVLAGAAIEGPDCSRTKRN